MEAPKRLSYCQVTNDVKCCKIEPFDHIRGSAGSSHVTELLHQEIDISLQERLLRNAFSGKAWANFFRIRGWLSGSTLKMLVTESDPSLMELKTTGTLANGTFLWPQMSLRSLLARERKLFWRIALYEIAKTDLIKCPFRFST
jgi:hypothetical protein